MPQQQERASSKDGMYKPDPHSEGEFAMDDPALREVNQVQVKHGYQARDE